MVTATADALVSFRSGLYDTFVSWRDALFELQSLTLDVVEGDDRWRTR